jgi:hypothetical protein
VPRKPLNNARERFVTVDKATRLVAAAASRNPRLAAIVQLLLLTGMRVSELLSAKWENVDGERRTLFVPTLKTGRSKYVPLAQAALDVIAALPREKGATYLFPTPRNPKKHLTTVKHGWQTARIAAKLPGLRIHDLRHSAASFMVNSGVDLFAVGMVLGHASVQSTSATATSPTRRCSPPSKRAPPSRPSRPDPLTLPRAPASRLVRESGQLRLYFFSNRGAIEPWEYASALLVRRSWSSRRRGSADASRAMNGTGSRQVWSAAVASAPVPPPVPRPAQHRAGA